MKSFSCFNCFGGQKAQRLESRQPVRQVPVENSAENSISLPTKVSDGFFVSAEAVKSDTKDVDDRPERELSDAVSTPSPKPEASSPPAEVKIDIPPSIAAEHNTANEDMITEQPKPTSPEDPVLVPQQEPIAEPINRITTSSSSSSQTGSSNSRFSISSLKQISTAATSPPSSPTESKAKSSPAGQTTLELATSTPLPTSPSSQEKEAPVPLLLSHSEDTPITITATNHSSVTRPATASSSSTSSSAHRPTLPRLSTTDITAPNTITDTNANPSKSSKRKSTSRLSLTRLLSRQTSHEEGKRRSKQTTLKKSWESLARREKGQKAKGEGGRGAEGEVEGVKAEEKGAGSVRLEGRKWRLDEGDDGRSLYCY